ncbi:MAG: nitrite reductase small subunit NirD [Acidimicrobiales bacterium]
MTVVDEPRTPIGICDMAALVPGRGVCALVDGVAVALFLVDGELYAIGNHDPFTDASVLSRGLVGSTMIDGNEVRYVASPLRKHRFELSSGRSLDDPEVTVGSWAVRCIDGQVLIGPEPLRSLE